MPGAVVHVHGEHDTVPTWAQFFNIPKVPKSVIDHLTDLHRQFGVGEFVPPIVKLPDGFSIIFFHQEPYEGPMQGATLDHGEVDPPIFCRSKVEIFVCFFAINLTSNGKTPVTEMAS